MKLLSCGDLVRIGPDEAVLRLGKDAWFTSKRLNLATWVGGHTSHPAPLLQHACGPLTPQFLLPGLSSFPPEGRCLILKECGWFVGVHLSPKELPLQVLEDDVFAEASIRSVK